MKKIFKLNRTAQLIAFSALLSLTVSCSDDDSTDTNQNIPTAQEFSSVREDALLSITQDFQFDASDGYVNLTSEKGVFLTINTNCLTLNGNPVSGTIDLEYVEIFSGGNMIVTNKPTMGLMNDGNKSLLLSGGEFYINATQNGQTLELSCPITINIPTSLTNPGGDPNMTLWDGTIDENGNLTWDEQEDTTGNQNIFIEGQGDTATYYAYFDSFGWTNVDQFYSDPNPKTTILASVPNGYDNQNSAIYLHYDGKGNALALLDTYDPVTGLFSEHYGQIPIGLDCHIIFTTESNGQWRYAIKEVTIEANAVYNFTLSETVLGTEQELIDAIDALP
ncbi:hypothetical protein NHF50_07840 [Flavobacterium sp. NRK F10]|uniref:Lipocalin-like domain-containing protein n=1 Tax=Flavobacterium sediminis TaxID=2201181 RepID=A0A2U8QUC7_9FLAO|nr:MULTISPECIES: hypothetical protein [Flavobacterium]AWM13797.1 hypothetical protein DI487_07920 [Flavobacterium sediminis]MCO6174957.1 hypothetical protein [Flavobacterium sp. NRK F10]